MGLVEMQEVGHDAVNFQFLFIEIVKRERVEYVLPQELGGEEEAKLVENGDVWMNQFSEFRRESTFISRDAVASRMAGQTGCLKIEDSVG
jgi:hypothetical protein